MICAIGVLLFGCQQIETNNKAPKSEGSEQPNLTVQNRQEKLQVARYKVSTIQPTFLSGVTKGTLEIKNSCLLLNVEGNPKPFLLSLPRSDDDNQWKVELKDNVLYFNNQQIHIGTKVDVGGGASDFSRLYVKPKGCENYTPWNAFNITPLS